MAKHARAALFFHFQQMLKMMKRRKTFKPGHYTEYMTSFSFMFSLSKNQTNYVLYEFCSTRHGTAPLYLERLLQSKDMQGNGHMTG